MKHNDVFFLLIAMLSFTFHAPFTYSGESEVVLNLDGLTPSAFCSSEDAFKASVISQISNGITGSDIFVVRPPTSEEVLERSPLGRSYRNACLVGALGLQEYCCLRCLKGNLESASTPILFMYPHYLAEKFAKDLSDERSKHSKIPPVSSEYQPGAFFPPYRIILLFARKQSTVKKEYARPFLQAKTEFINDEQRELHDIATEVQYDIDNLTDSAFISKYGLMDIFTNRVFEIAPRCVWEVMLDNSANDEDWDKEIGNRRRLHTILRLSSREVSEIVYLAYQLDGPSGAEGYATACGRCPELLLPVHEITTELGRRLRDALADKLAAAQGDKAQ